MSEKLGLKIDLRQQSLIDDEDNKPDLCEKTEQNSLRKKQDQLDTYIMKFIGLNSENKLILEKQTEKLNKSIENKMDYFKIINDENVKNMKSLFFNDDESKKAFRQEVENNLVQI